MRENSSMCVKMIDGNWVLKRKRKRLSGLDLSIRKEGFSQSLESPRKNLAKQKLKGKGDFNTSQPECKKKGNDGYYYECVICDLGGNLLCCDSCPRTYHLQCLDPPLKSG